VPRATHILQVPVIGQPIGYECCNTAMACVLQCLGVHYTVSELAALAGTTTGYCEYTDADWLRVWYDTDTPAYQLVKNWYMVVNYDGRLFADQIGDGADHRPPRGQERAPGMRATRA
jgi:hypothetical protein